MPSKYQEYRQMADTAERQLTSSYKSWTQFLRTAARLYKYPYNEQVMIHAQRPDATACAEYDFWNKKMGRFKRGEIRKQAKTLISSRFKDSGQTGYK